MQTKLSPSFSRACSLLCLFATINSWACGGNSSLTITNLPFDAGDQVTVVTLNAPGQVGGFTGNAGSQPFIYTAGNVLELGTLGGSSAQLHAMNNSGDAVGDSLNNDGTETHAFLFTAGNMLDLGTLGGSFSTATGVNDSQQVVGTSNLPGDNTHQAFLYSSNVMTSLGDLGGGSSSATAINKAGVIIGDSLDTNGNSHGFIYMSGVMTDLGTLGGNYSSPRAINDAGVVVGESAALDGSIHAFEYAGGVMTDLGTLGGLSSSASAINNAGQVIGSWVAADSSPHGFLYDGGVSKDLGDLGGNSTYAQAINNPGVIAGNSMTAIDPYFSDAVIWTNGVMVDLNSLLPTNTEWFLVTANLINDNGRVAGYGFFNGDFAAFVMDLQGGGGSGSPPTAVAGPNQTVSCPTPVTLNGGGSSASDGGALTYQWTENGAVLGTSVTLTASFSVGTHTITLTVTDACGDSAQANVVVTVTDNVPPTVSCPGALTASSDANCEAAVPDLTSQVVASDNCTPAGSLVITQSPAAGALVETGPHVITVTVKDAAGNAATCTTLFTVKDTTPPVIVGGPAPVTVKADVNCEGAVPNVAGQIVATDNCTPANALVITQKPAAGQKLGLGQHPIIVTVTDAAGNRTSGSTYYTVVDATPPVIHYVAATPNVLSPADGRLVNVKVTVVATDNCDPFPVSKVVSITCNEPTRPIDGDKDDPIQITGNLTAKLRAWRDDNGKDRVYTITVRSTDASGNSSTASTTVTVPRLRDHDDNDNDGDDSNDR